MNFRTIIAIILLLLLARTCCLNIGRAIDIEFGVPEGVTIQEWRW